MSAWRQTGRKPAELRDAPPLPPLAAHVWAYYAELHRSRDENGWGAQGLKMREIEAWSRLRRVSLDPWELDAILAIDRAFRAAADAQAEANKEAG